MYPKITINDVTIRPAPYARRFAEAREAGFTGVEIWMDEARKYAQENGGPAAVADLLKENNLRLDQVLLLGDAFSDQHLKNRKAYLENAESIFKETQAVGGDTLALCATFGQADLKESPALFAELCDLADEYGIRLSLEFIGWAEIIKDLKTAWEIVDKAGRKNGGILYDTFHHFFGGTGMKDLEQVPTEYIFAVHIVDAHRMDISTLEISRKHRVFPGEGQIPIPEILSVLRDKDYKGFFSLEIFNELYWQRPSAELAGEGFDAMSRMISAAGF